MNSIEIENLSHRFSDGTMGVKDINLCIKKGELVVLAGPNGSGKTTLLRHINGLLLPSAGAVRLFGVPILKDLKKTRQTVGMVFQDAESQIVGETVYDDAAFGPENLRLNAEEVKACVAGALTAVGLEDLAHNRPHTLSGGEKRRLCIAGVLAMNPEVVIFDEPFSSLDYPGTGQVLRQILYLNESGRTVIIATHDLEKIIAHANRLIIMERGEIVRQGPPQELVKGIETFGIREPCASRFGMGMVSWLS